MTFKIFNRTLGFHFRNGVGLDLEFSAGRAIWVSREADTSEVEAALFNGVTLLFPFMIVSFGLCYIKEESE
jgi:hypothetical protein